MDGNGGLTPWGPSDDDDDQDDEEDRGGTTGGEEPEQMSTSGADDDQGDTEPMPEEDDGTSTGEDPEMGESTGTADTLGEPDDDDGGGGSQPASGPWSACPADGECGPDLNCIVSDLIVASLCVESCMPVGDPSGCTPPPGGNATPACLPVNGSSYCVLDCSSGETCPGGMVCHEEDGTSLCI